jgi:hypothetical protein
MVLAEGRMARISSLRARLPSRKILFLITTGFYFGLALHFDRSWKERNHARGVIQEFHLNHI